MDQGPDNAVGEPIAPASSQFVSAASLRRRLDWLNRLRWGAAAAVLGGALVAGPWLHLPLAMGRVVLTAAGLAVLNLLYVVRNRRQPALDIPTELRLVKVQMVGDLLILTELLNLTGGLENPFFFIYIIHVILASLLFKGREIYQIAILAIVLFTGEVMGEYLGWLPHNHLLGGSDLTHSLPFVLAGLGAFWLVLLTGAYLGASIMKHNRAIKDELVERQAALIAADGEKMEFFRFVTHEVKSPVSTAQSAVEAALELDGGGLSAPVRDLLQRGLVRLEQANSMVRDLADLTRGGVLRHDEISELDVREVITLVVDRLDDLAARRGVALVWQAPPAPVPLPTNAGMMEKIITNLLGNAIRYTGRGDKVEVSLGSTRTAVQVVVADEGIGIAPADQAHIFDEFYRTPQAREMSRLGTGLGLAIVRRFVERLGGEITLVSEEGRGSTFTVTWPVTGIHQEREP